MAPRANWKGFLRLSLVTCPVALYPATSDSEKISFNQINRNTGHRIKYMKVDADTGEEVSNEDIMKGTRSIPIPTSRYRRTSWKTSPSNPPVPSTSTSSFPRATSILATSFARTTWSRMERSATTPSPSSEKLFATWTWWRSAAWC